MKRINMAKTGNACFFIAIATFILLLIIGFCSPANEGYDFIIKYWYLFLIFWLSVGILRLHKVFGRNK